MESWDEIVHFAFALLFALFCSVPLYRSPRRVIAACLRARPRRQASAPQHLRDYVQNGKLSLSLRDAILLTLENNSNVQIEETQVESQKFALLASFSLSILPSRAVSTSIDIPIQPTASYKVWSHRNITLNSLSQTGQVSYTQTFAPGQAFSPVYQQQVLYQ